MSVKLTFWPVERHPELRQAVASFDNGLSTSAKCLNKTDMHIFLRGQSRQELAAELRRAALELGSKADELAQAALNYDYKASQKWHPEMEWNTPWQTEVKPQRVKLLSVVTAADPAALRKRIEAEMAAIEREEKALCGAQRT